MTPFVTIDDLQYAYPPVRLGEQSHSVLKGVSLSLAEGECLALLGRTGAGKSTLCLTLNGIIPHLVGGVFRGEVRVAGRSTRESHPGELSQSVGIVFQDPDSQLFSMTVEDEVAFGPESLALSPRQIEVRVGEALEMMGIRALRNRSPLELSGGEKQRVALAAVMAMRPQLLVLDEPTASLDPAGKQAFLESLCRLRSERGTSVLWVTQEVDRVPLVADRVAVLHDGRIPLEGGLREVFGRVEEVRQIGLALPQMTELAARFESVWDTDYDWLTVEDAFRDLREVLGD